MKTQRKRRAREKGGEGRGKKMREERKEETGDGGGKDREKKPLKH